MVTTWFVGGDKGDVTGEMVMLGVTVVKVMMEMNNNMLSSCFSTSS